MPSRPFITAALNEDTGFYVVSLPHGDYRVNGEMVKGNCEIQADSVDAIHSIVVSKIHAGWMDGDGVRLSKDDYDAIRGKLLTNAETITDGDDYFSHYEFEDLEEEYDFKRFERRWQKFFHEHVEVSEALPVQVAKVKYNTGSPFIIAPNIVGSLNPKDVIYTYDRKSAVVAFAHEAFKSVGCDGHHEERFSNQFANQNKTSLEKIYFYDDIKIRFWKAFGGYVFSDKWDIRSNPKLSFEDAQKALQRDKEEIETIVKSKYAEAFGLMDSHTALATLQKVLKKIDSAQWHLNKVEPFKKTSSEFYRAIKELREAGEIYKKSMSEQA